MRATVELIRDVYEWFLDRRGRLSLRGLLLFEALYLAVAMIAITALRAVFATAPSSAVLGFFIAIAVAFWCSPLGIWAFRAIRSDGLLRRENLSATPAVVISWGFLVGAIYPVVGKAPAIVMQKISIALIAGLCIFVVLHLLDRVALVDVAIGLVVATATIIVALGRAPQLAAWIHVEHTHRSFAAVRVEALFSWIGVVGLTIGAAATVGLHLLRRSRRLRPRHRLSPPYTQGQASSIPTRADTPLHRTPDVGIGARTWVDRMERRLEKASAAVQRARAGEDAERVLAEKLTEALQHRGWHFEFGAYSKGPHVGDADVIATGPSGACYAIDAKWRDPRFPVDYDQQLADLVVLRPNGPFKTEMMRKIKRLTRMLEGERSIAFIRPILCIIGARVECTSLINGVAILPIESIIG